MTHPKRLIYDPAAWLPLATRLQRALRLSFERVGTRLFGHSSASENPVIPP